MAVTTDTSSIDYDGNGTTVDFSVPFRFHATTDLVVTLTPDGETPVLLVEGNDYTVDLCGDTADGSITLFVAPASGETLSIERTLSLTQATTFTTQGTFSPALHERALDKRTFIEQQLLRRIETLEAAVAAPTDLTLANYNSLLSSLTTLEARVRAATFNVMDYGAVADGVTDDSVACQAAITAALLAGGTVYFPVGVYAVNLSIVGTDIHLTGSAVTGSDLGTKLVPYSLTSPCLAIGNGVGATNNIRVSNMTIKGTATGASSDGVYINGAIYCSFDGLQISYFGRDNLRITSTEARPTSYLHFERIALNTANRYCLNVDYGASAAAYVTAVYINNFSISGKGDAAARALYLHTASLYLSNGWIECGGNAQGHVEIDSSGSATGPILWITNIAIDSGSSTDVLVTIDSAKTLVSGFIRGLGTIDGVVAWNSGTTNVNPAGGMLGEVWLSEPHVTNRLNFGRADAGTDQEDVTNLTYIFRSGANPNQFLAFSSNFAIRPLMTRAYPLQVGGGGAIWRDANNNLRHSNSTWWPETDADGHQMSCPHAAAAPSTGTWIVGDKMWATDPAGVGFMGWVCTVAGTPGTWKTFGAVTP